MTHPFLDLSPDRADALLDAALERRHAIRLREAAAPILAGLEPGARLLGEHLVEEVARLSARVDALAQAQAAAALSREERLRIDPLRTIPAARLAAAAGGVAPPEAGPAAVEAGDDAFLGFGWFAAERTEGGSLRWSGGARCATLLLPALGGGDVVLTLALRSPFGVPLDLSGQDWFLDGVPLSFATVGNDGTTGIFEARATLPPMPAGARVTLLLHGAQHEDPATGPRRDTRRLGLGLAWARIERA
ncbi:hypothetical protein [Falsiroseomonas sp. CW058]|uniref:hypothetical protein n=1 Tax=Falsiroseomonas sp. CW058 TaxID=3388664 RepID=UPI003D31D777